MDCEKGTFNNKTGQQIKSDCTSCTGGYYCPGGCKRSNPQTEGDCLVGMNPDVESSITNGFVCPKGWYCAAGQDAQMCPAGTYNNKEGAYSDDFCVDCPDGIDCPEGSSDYDNPDIATCPPGKYCEGTDQFDCGKGYYCDGEGRKPCPVATYGDLLEAQDSVLIHAGARMSGSYVGKCF